MFKNGLHFKMGSRFPEHLIILLKWREVDRLLGMGLRARGSKYK